MNTPALVGVFAFLVPSPTPDHPHNGVTQTQLQRQRVTEAGEAGPNHPNQEVALASFVALYRGESVATAELVTISADPELVREFADRMLAERDGSTGDPAVDAMRGGRRQALKVVRDEAEEAGDGKA